MPVWLGVLLGGLVDAVGTLVGKVLVSLGIGYVAYTGIDTSITWLSTQIAAQAGSLGTVALQVFSAFRIGTGVSILLSALSIRWLLMGLQSGTVKRMVVK